MFVPPYQQQVCPRCGRLPAFPAPTCPSCQAPLALPSPGGGQSPGRFPPPPLFPFPPMAPAPQPPGPLPLVIELLLNLIGIYGVGWLLRGKTGVGVMMLVGSLLFWGAGAVLAILTLGLSILCLAPVAIVALVCNLLLLQQATRSAS